MHAVQISISWHSFLSVSYFGMDYKMNREIKTCICCLTLIRGQQWGSPGCRRPEQQVRRSRRPGLSSCRCRAAWMCAAAQTALVAAAWVPGRPAAAAAAQVRRSWHSCCCRSPSCSRPAANARVRCGLHSSELPALLSSTVHLMRQRIL